MRCIWCHQTFKPKRKDHKTCSRICSYKNWNSKLKVKHKKKRCKTCKKWFQPKNIRALYCSISCRNYDLYLQIKLKSIQYKGGDVKSVDIINV